MLNLVRSVFSSPASSFPRYLSSSARVFNEIKPTGNPTSANSREAIQGLRMMVVPSSMEKHFLVWSKKYKTVTEVPDKVPYETLSKARSKARIRIANVLVALTAFSCVLYIISGKRAADRGETVSKMNEDWHKRYNEIANKPAEVK